MTFSSSHLQIHPNLNTVAVTDTRNRSVKASIEKFDHRRGLNSLQVHACVIDQNGFLWAAAPIGLIRYDGVQFKVYGQKQGLASHGLRTLALHPESKRLWIGTDRGVEVLDITSGTPVSHWENPVGTVNCLALTAHHVFVGSSLGLFEWDGATGLTQTSNPNLKDDTIQRAQTDYGGNIWIIGSASGLIRISPNGAFTHFDDLAEIIGKPIALASGPDSGLFIGGTQGVAFLKQSGDVLVNRALSAPVDALLWDNHKLWISYGERLVSFNFENLEITSRKPVLQDAKIKHILNDRFDNIWLSSSGRGLLKLSSFRHTFVDDFPTEVGQVMSIHVDNSGRLTGGSKGLVLQNGTVILKNMEVWDVLRDRSGKIWAATDKGLYLTPHPHLTMQYRHDDCPVIRAPCRTLIEYKGQIYISSIRGLARIGAEGVDEIYDPDGESIGYVYSLHIGPNDNLWIATLGRGVFRFDGHNVTPHRVDGMSPSSNVYAITHDDQGRLYYAHNNKITREDADGECTTILNSDDPVVAWSIHWLSKGNLVAGTSSGLKIYDDESGKLQRQISGLFEDLPWEFTTSRSLAVIDSSTLLCGLGSGLRTVQLKNLLFRNDAPIATLGAASWRGVEPVIDDGIAVVPVGNWHLEVHLATEWFLDECRMQYRLEGFDSDWSEFSKIGPIRYTSLPPGEYSLKIILQSALAGSGPAKNILTFKVTS